MRKSSGGRSEDVDRSLVRRVVLIAGLPLGFLCAFATSLDSPISWLDLVATTTVTGSLLGAVLGGVAHGFARHVRRSGGTVTLFFVAMLASAFTAGTAIYLGSMALPHGRWIRLLPPPEPVREFVGPTCYHLGHPGVYVRAVSGQLYAFRRGDGEPTWSREDSLPAARGEPDVLCSRAVTSRAWTPLKPGPVLASRRIDLRHADCGGRDHYVLLRDGSIWRWGAYECAIGSVIFFFMYEACVLGVGLITALAVVLLPPPLGWPRSGAAKYKLRPEAHR
jgi:hypothetical protein